MAKVRARAFEGRVWFDAVDVINVVNEMALKGMTSAGLASARRDLEDLLKRVEVFHGMG